MNNHTRYKLDTAGIVAFIVGVIVLTTVVKVLYTGKPGGVSLSILITTDVVIVLVATLFGPISGSLTGFLGVVCGSAYIGMPILFVDALSFAIVGLLVGLFADKYGVRENSFTLKNMYLWNVTHIMALIVSFIFVRPYLNYLFMKIDLFNEIGSGINTTIICAFPVGIVLTCVLFLVSKSVKFVTK